MAYERFVDRNDTKNLMTDCPDFVLRRHGIPPSWIVYLFVIVLLLILIMVNYLTITLILLPKDSQIPLDKILLFLLTIAVLLTGVAIFSYTMVNKIREIILQTEFQNLLFANSASVGSEFSLIANSNKNVIYYNYGFDKMFPQDAPSCEKSGESEDIEQQVVTRLLTSSGFSDSAKEELVNAIERNTKIETEFLFKNSDGSEEKLRVTVDPLKRPSSHVIIRGYSS